MYMYVCVRVCWGVCIHLYMYLEITNSKANQIGDLLYGVLFLVTYTITSPKPVFSSKVRQTDPQTFLNTIM